MFEVLVLLDSCIINTDKFAGPVFFGTKDIFSCNTDFGIFYKFEIKSKPVPFFFVSWYNRYLLCAFFLLQFFPVAGRTIFVFFWLVLLMYLKVNQKKSENEMK